MKFRISYKVALTTFLTAGIGVLLFALLSFGEVSGYFKQNLLSSLTQEVMSDSNEIKNQISELKNDIISLYNNESISGILRANNNPYKYDAKSNATYEGWIEKFKKTSSIILEQNENYYQIRLIGINNNGKELVKVIKRDGLIYFLKDNELQEKEKRYYFKETVKLKENEIYISNIDLNQEYKTVETPIVPTVRVSVPIYNKDELFGVLVINANSNKLFNLVNKESAEGKRVYLVNESGDYLYNQESKKMFAFEYGKEFIIQKDFKIEPILSDKVDDLSLYTKDDLALSSKKIFLDENRFIVLVKTATNKFLNEQSQKYKNQIFIYIILIIFFIVLVTAAITRYIALPIMNLTRKAKIVSDSKGEVSVNFKEIKSNDEIGELSRSLENMLENLLESKKEISLFASSLEYQVAFKTEELQELNKDLEKKVQVGIEENRTKDTLLAQQTKLASMGEMIGSIAHQWRQPLNSLHINIEMLEEDYEDKLIDEKYLEEFIHKNTQTLQFMSKTIDDFRNFFKVDKDKVDFDVRKKVTNTLTIQSAQFKNYNIQVNLNDETFKTNGFPGEFQQVILNIVNNSKDAMVENHIEHGKIDINIEVKGDVGIITIEDNAKGIPQDVIDRVFEPYFTTKEQGKGTGIGLYMSKMIVEKNMQGKLYVENINEGVRFIIELGVLNEQ